MKFDTKTILIIAAVLFVLYMLSQRGTSTYEHDNKKDMLGKILGLPVEKEKYCPSCGVK